MEVLWDTPENVARAKQKVDYVLNGCKCKTGCHTRRCSCQKNGKNCGPGCRCIGCGNVASATADSDANSDDDELHNIEIEDILNEPSDGGSTDASDDDFDQFENDANICERDVHSIMSLIFGEDEDSEDNPI